MLDFGSELGVGCGTGEDGGDVLSGAWVDRGGVAIPDGVAGELGEVGDEFGVEVAVFIPERESADFVEDEEHDGSWACDGNLSLVDGSHGEDGIAEGAFMEKREGEEEGSPSGIAEKPAAQGRAAKDEKEEE